MKRFILLWSFARAANSLIGLSPKGITLNVRLPTSPRPLLRFARYMTSTTLEFCLYGLELLADLPKGDVNMLFAFYICLRLFLSHVYRGNIR